MRLDGRGSGVLVGHRPGQMQRGDTMKSGTATATARAQSSAEFVDRIRAGDDSVWRDLIDQYEPLLRWVARRHGLSTEDTADVIQFTWLRCLEHIDQLTHADRLPGWLTTICRRECIQLATKKRREVLFPDFDITQLIDDQDGECDPCAEVARRDECDRLNHAITALPDRQRTVVVELLRPEHQSYIDLSDRLGLPVGSIGPTWQRALIRLRHDPRLADPSAVSMPVGA
jgi:RNA polymerase sigma factor (sigma-70 family)